MILGVKRTAQQACIFPQVLMGVTGGDPVGGT